MKGTAVTIVIISILAIMMTFLVGCGAEKEGAHEAFILFGVHQNQGVISTSGFEKALLKQCEIPGNNIHLLVIDGNPYELGSYTVPDQGFALLPSQKKANAEDYEKQLMAVLKKAGPKSAEVSYAGALESIGNNVADNTDYDILIYGSGLDTTGSVNYTRNLILYDPQQYTKLLEDNHMLPDLSGAGSVTWFGLGCFDGVRQEKLSSGQYQQFKSQWENYLNGAGVDKGCIHLYAGESSGEPISDELPEVTAVDFPEVDPYASGNEGAASVINESLLGGFSPDTADFLDPAKADAFAAELASNMKTGQWIVCGFTASDSDNNWTRELSLRRAESVKKLLIKNGIDESCLTALGGGTGMGTQYHIDGLGTGSEAQKNRITVICSTDSEQGKDLMQKYYK